MKTLLKLMTLVLACLLVLSACQTPAGTTGSTQPSATQAPSQSTAPQSKPVDPAKIAEFNALFGDLNGWYNRFLTCQYQSAANISLKQIFYIGFPQESKTPTAAEWAELSGLEGFQAEMDLIRLPREKMNDIISKYFAIPLDALPAEAFEGLVYLESTDCYYFMANDAVAAMGFQAVTVEEMKNGTVHVEYTLADSELHYALTLFPFEGEYLLLSNVVIAQGE